MTIVTGRVVGEGDDLLLYDAELRIAGGDPTRHLKRGALKVTTDDGLTIDVETTRSTVLVAPRQKHGKWGDLLDDPLSRPFDGEAPGDHVEVALSGVTVSPGDTVAILGDQDARLEADGYRNEREVLRALEARVIARGEDPADALSRWQQEEADARQKAEEDARKARRASRQAPTDVPVKSQLVGLVVGLVVLSAGLAASFADAGPGYLRVALPAAGILLAALCTLVIRRRRFLPSFATPDDHIRGRATRWSTPELTGVIGFAGPVLGLGVVLSVYGNSLLGRLLLAFVGLVAIGFALRLLWDERRSVPFVKMLLDAPPWRPGESGMRAVVMSVDRGKLHRERKASKRNDGFTTWEFDYSTELSVSDQFELAGRTSDGTSVVIRPGGALFGSTRRSAELRVLDTALEGLVREEIGVGDEVLVLGRFEKKNDVLTAAAAGPESLVILGAGGDVRSAARRALAMHRASILGLLALGALGFFLAWTDPYTTHEAFVGQVTSVSGRPDVQPGDACEVAVSHDGTRHDTSCQVRIECGGVVLHGGPMSGFLDCSIGEDDWETASAPGSELSFTPPNHVEVRPGSGAVVQIVVER